jgi:hypothetical protein
MKHVRVVMLSLLMVLLCGLFSPAQQSVATAANASVPPLIQFSDVATDEGGNSLSGVVNLTFSLYAGSQGGEPLWTETQNNVPLDPAGHYSVQLGITKPAGVPTTLFTSGEARWLGVRIAQQPEQPRVLLLSVPYALKAGDAATIGGLPPSAFMLAAPGNGAASAYTTESSTEQGASPLTATDVTTTGGTVDYLPLFNGTSTILDSVLFQSGTGATARIGVGTTVPTTTLDVKGPGTVRGVLLLPAVGTATAAKGASSQPLALTASTFSSTSGTAVAQNFRWQAQPVGNDTSSASGSLDLLYSSGTNVGAETGLQISAKGLFTFAPGQTFPGTGSITGVTTASTSGLTGGGTSGTLSLGLLNTCATNQVLQWSGSAWACASVSGGGGGTITGVIAGTDLTGGGTSGSVTLNVNTAKIPQLSAANTFVGNQTVTGNVTASGEVQGGVINATTGFDIAGIPFAFGSTSTNNAFVGFAGNSTMTGTYNFGAGPGNLEGNSTGYSNTGVGSIALANVTTGAYNTAVGNVTLLEDTTGYENTAVGGLAAENTSGSDNTAVGMEALYNNTTGGGNTALGIAAGPDPASTGLNNSTAIGESATVSANNSLVLGQTIAGSPGASFVNVGVGTATPRSILEVSASVTEGLGPTITLTNPGEGVGAAASIDLNSYLPSTTGTYNPAARIEAVDQDNASDAILFQSNVPGKFNNGLQTNMEVTSTGQVLVGSTTNPQDYQLFVQQANPGDVYTAAAGAYGYSVPPGSGQLAGDGFLALGGNGDSLATDSYAGVGVVGQGGNGVDLDGFGGDESGGAFAGGDSAAGTSDGYGDGIDAYAGSGWAGYFDGDVNTNGSYLTGGASVLKIDHPLDAANKYLVHSSVESSEMMNIYTGNVTTDGQGLATVHLPDWFEVLNTDFRYQLTVIGQFAQAIVSSKVASHQFSIKTDKPNVEVSWQITGVRQDAYAKAHPLVVEPAKNTRERGHYIHPELYGASEQQSIAWARHPQMMQRMKETRARQLAASQRPAPTTRAAAQPLAVPPTPKIIPPRPAPLLKHGPAQQPAAPRK